MGPDQDRPGASPGGHHIEHGTVEGCDHGCCCRECLTASRRGLAVLPWWAADVSPSLPIEHGTLAGYEANCCCSDCLAEARAVAEEILAGHLAISQVSSRMRLLRLKPLSELLARD